MLQEYTVDPNAVYRNLDTLQRFLSEFKAGNGRVISELPQRWEREQQDKIRELQLSPIAKRKCFDQIKAIAKISVIGECNIPSELKGWIEKARYLKGKGQINAIITQTCHAKNAEYDYANFLEQEPEKWEIGQSLTIDRNAQSMANAIENSLSIANMAMFIDPYFHPTDERFRAPLLAFIEKVKNGRRQCNKIFIHTTEQSDKKQSELIRGLDLHIKPKLTADFSIETWIWSSKKLHDRFILTKNVGYAFGHGLDEASYQNATSLNINRLSEDVRAEKFKEFSTQDNCIGEPIITIP